MHQQINEAEVNSRAVISVHTKPETSRRLDDLAAVTRRSKSYLANEAIERYLADEEAFVASVHRGITDAEAGRVVPTGQARARIQSAVDKLAKDA
jgi:predicted transcriptional regulator